MNDQLVRLTETPAEPDDTGGHDAAASPTRTRSWDIPGVWLRNDGRHPARLYEGGTYRLVPEDGQWLFHEVTEQPHMDLVDEITGRPIAGLAGLGGGTITLNPALTYMLCPEHGYGVLREHEPAAG